MTELELHRSRHERDVDGEGSRGEYPPDRDAILRYRENVLVGPLIIVSGTVSPSQRKA